MNKKKILIVDDTVANIDILIELLKDYNIIDTTSGKDALLIAQNEKIDLVLLDIVMPEMNGYEVCRKLKQNQKIKDIPIIFITAKTDEDSIEEAYESGGIDYITKPFKPKELLTKVKTHLELHRKTLNLKDLVEKSRYLKILYIEDDKINQEQTLKIFKNFFEYVDTAVDGKDGLKQYVTKDKNFYDIVISDINMPKLNGIELSKKILDINKKQKIVLMSGFYDLDNLAEIISLGISSYIQKPISLNIFIDTLSKIVNQIEN
jgi:CheY-like chemotaxis protein